MRAPPAIPFLLVVLAFWDLQGELRLLSDHFTWIALFSAIAQHPLAVGVLALSPSLVRRYR